MKTKISLFLIFSSLIILSSSQRVQEPINGIVFSSEAEAIGLPLKNSTFFPAGQLITDEQWQELYDANKEDLQEFVAASAISFADTEIQTIVQEAINLCDIKNNVAVYCHNKNKREPFTTSFMDRELSIIDRSNNEYSFKDPRYDQAYPPALLVVPTDISRTLLIAKIYHELGHIANGDLLSQTENSLEDSRKEELAADIFAFEKLLNNNRIESFLSYMQWLTSLSKYDQNYDEALWKHPQFSERIEAGIITLKKHLAAKNSNLEEFIRAHERASFLALHA